MDARGPTPTGWVPDALAAVLAVGVLVGVLAHIPAGPGRPLDALGYALLVAAGVSMGLCRRWPQAAAGVVTAVLAVFVAAFALRNRGQARHDNAYRHRGSRPGGPGDGRGVRPGRS